MAEAKNIVIIGGSRLQSDTVNNLLKKVGLFGPFKIYWVDMAAVLEDKHRQVIFKFCFLVQRLSGGPLGFDDYRECFRVLPGVPVLALIREFNPDIPRLATHEDGIYDSLLFSELTESTLEVAMRNIFLLNRTHKNLREKVDQLRKVQKMDMMGPLAAGILHDFNNLLEIIHGNTELLERKTKKEPALSKNINEILGATEEAGKLSKQLSDYSKNIEKTLSAIDIQSVIRDMEGLLDRMAGDKIKLTITSEKKPALVAIDRSQFGQIIMNLIVNARDAQPARGAITVNLSNIELDKELMKKHSFMNAGKYALLNVKDTGEGISKEVREKIFEPFFTTKKGGKGTGLGLSTIYGIVKQYGGYILVESEPGSGTEFNVYLPLADKTRLTGISKQTVPRPAKGKAAASSELAIEAASVPELKLEPVKSPPTTASTGGGKTILLVEDEESIRSLLKDTLEFEGYLVFDADDGVKALELSQDHSGAIDLLITDVYMSKMNGPDLAKKIIADRPDIEILYMSGFVKDKSIMDKATEKSYSFVQKPFPLKTLTDTVLAIFEN